MFQKIITRARSFGRALGIVGLLFTIFRTEAIGSAADVIGSENRRAGSDDWQLTRVRADRDGFRSHWIEGYCSKQSVKAGDSIDIMVSTDPAKSFRLEIFRTGYYGGRGARLMKTLEPFEGKTQATPSPGEKNIHECHWEPTAQFTIPTDWMSGVYLGRLTTIPESEEQPYWQSYVRSSFATIGPRDILFQCSDNTWQAYNRWPNNYSIYTHPKGNQGPWADVSFDRPYGREAAVHRRRQRSADFRFWRIPSASNSRWRIGWKSMVTMLRIVRTATCLRQTAG